MQNELRQTVRELVAKEFGCAAKLVYVVARHPYDDPKTEPKYEIGVWWRHARRMLFIEGNFEFTPFSETALDKKAQRKFRKLYPVLKILLS